MRSELLATSRLIRLVMIACSGMLWASASSAAEPTADAIDEATDYVRRALTAEAEGDFLSRDRLLTCAAMEQDDAPQLKWQTGHIALGDKQWYSIEEAIEQYRKNPRLTSYEKRRSQLIDTATSHMALARWCVANSLPFQARAHFERVLQADEDNIPARAALGYQLVNGQWVAPPELEELRLRVASAQAALKTYGNQLLKIRTGLSSNSQEARARSTSALFSIKDEEAVSAVESVFAGVADDSLLVVVDWLSQRESVDSSRALLRIAFGAASTAIRQSAVDELKTRPLGDFVPETLQLLSSPISVLSVPTFNRDGSLAGYRQAFAKEDQDRRDVFMIDTSVQRVTVNLIEDADQQVSADARLVQSPDSRDALDNLVAERNLRTMAAMETQLRAAAAQRENQNIVSRNARVAALLTDITGKEFSGDAREMWKWWDDTNETDYQRFKKQAYRQQSQRRFAPRFQTARYVEPQEASSRPVSEFDSSGPFRRQFRSSFGTGFVGGGECFVAGTRVLTSRGLRPIEQIVAGDMIFSRDTTSGAILLRPVLRTTLRPASPTITLFTGEQKLQCSRGHLLWVSGHGWKKASQIEPGDVLHSAKYPVVVTDKKQAPDMPTYNLEIAETANYFVGENYVLSQDVTPQKPTRLVVPGLQLALQ